MGQKNKDRRWEESQLLFFPLPNDNKNKEYCSEWRVTATDLSAVWRHSCQVTAWWLWFAGLISWVLIDVPHPPLFSGWRILTSFEQCWVNSQSWSSDNLDTNRGLELINRADSKEPGIQRSGTNENLKDKNLKKKTWVRSDGLQHACFLNNIKHTHCSRWR